MFHVHTSWLPVLMVCVGPSADVSAENAPELDGIWHVVSMVQDGKPAPFQDLKGAYAKIKDGRMVFHLPAKPEYPNLQVKFEFVQKGIDLAFAHGDVDDPAEDVGRAPGAWRLSGDMFRFAFFDHDDAKTRPEVAPGKGVIFILLKRKVLSEDPESGGRSSR